MIFKDTAEKKTARAHGLEPKELKKKRVLENRVWKKVQD